MCGWGGDWGGLPFSIELLPCQMCTGAVVLPTQHLWALLLNRPMQLTIVLSDSFLNEKNHHPHLDEDD